MHDSAVGIVLHVQEYKENSSLVRVLSDKYGKITLLARGIKKMTSKNAASCQLFHEATFEFERNPQKDLHILKSTVLQNPHISFTQDLLKASIASCMCEIIDRCESEMWQYDLLHEALAKLEQEESSLLVMSLFMSEVLKKLGIAPVVDQCVICQTNPHIQTFSIQHGGFICIDCNQKFYEPNKEVEELTAIRYLVKASLENIDVLKNYPCQDSKYLQLLMDFYEFHTSTHLKSYRFLKQMLNQAIS